MKNTITDSGVTITKTVDATEETTVFHYTIDPHGSTAGQLRLTEQLSEPVERSALSLSEHPAGSWDVHSDDLIEFTADFSHSEPLEPTVRIASPTIDPQECTSTLTVSSTVAAESASTATPNGNEKNRPLTALNNFFQPGVSSHTNGGQTVVHDGSNATVVVPIEQYHTTENVSMPALGLIATDENIGSVARTIVRATEYGLTVVAVVDRDHSTAASILKQLDAVVIQPEDRGLAVDQLKAYLIATVRDTPYAGIIFHEDCAEQISFEESVQTFETSDETVVEAVSAPTAADVIVGIPAFNEAETVGAVVTEARNYADAVVVVDDGSSDDTADVSRQAGATVIEHERNRGYGHGLKTLFEYADSHDVDSLVILDADGQHEPRDIPKLVAVHETSGAEIVIGNRFGATARTEMPLYRRCGLWVITQLVNLSMGKIRPTSQIQDAQSGFRSYNSTAINSIAEQTDAIDNRMSASTDILYHAHANGFDIEEVSTTISYDVSNANTRNPITHGVSIVNNICKKIERNNPLTVVGIPGILLMAVGIALGYSTLSAYAVSGEVAVEATVGSVVFVLIGAFALLFSLVRHVLHTALGGHYSTQI